MVRAILDGRKTQTRRIVNPQPVVQRGWVGGAYWERRPERGRQPADHWCIRDMIQFSPYGQPGDRLWVREAWRVGKPHDTTAPRDILRPLIARGFGVTVLYEAGGWRSVGPAGRYEPLYRDDQPMPDWAGKARPSMFMPRAFSRITLEVTDVRVERLFNISEEDALAEGCDPRDINPVGWYAALWDSLNADRGYGWRSNPWVWVVAFRKVTT